MIFIIQGFQTFVFICIIFTRFRPICLPVFFRYPNFWDEAWWFLSVMLFGLLSSSLLYSQRFSRYVLRSSLGIRISETKLNDFYHSGFSDYRSHLYCYIHVSTDMSLKLFQVFLVELKSQHETSNHILYLIHRLRLLWFRPHGLNKGRGSKIRAGSWVRQETPEDGQEAYRPKRCEYNNKDQDNSPKTLNDNIIQTSLQI